VVSKVVRGLEEVEDQLGRASIDWPIRELQSPLSDVYMYPTRLAVPCRAASRRAGIGIGFFCRDPPKTGALLSR